MLVRADTVDGEDQKRRDEQEAEDNPETVQLVERRQAHDRPGVDPVLFLRPCQHMSPTEDQARSPSC